MPTATDPLVAHGHLRARRGLLVGLGSVALDWMSPQSALAAAQPGAVLVAAWSEGPEHFVGVLQAQAGRLLVRSSMVVPTRAHGLLALPDGSMLAVARRPGDWLLRWFPRTGRVQWAWVETGCVFNGHALLMPELGRVLTTETDTDSGAGHISVRDLKTLALRDRWPTLGMDPHALLMYQEHLWVANGGIPTQPETGRVKRDRHRMDSSLVALDPASGKLCGQWRLPDRRLSLRHLAADGLRIGVALQAEHDDVDERQRAPLLAVWEAGVLDVPHAASATPPLTGGYGGDVAALGTLGDGFAVSATRANGLMTWRPGEGWRMKQILNSAGALVRAGDRLWAGGIGGIELAGPRSVKIKLPAAMRLDNHWTAYADLDFARPITSSAACRCQRRASPSEFQCLRSHDGSCSVGEQTGEQLGSFRRFSQ
jgi:hypothetical protein